MDIHPRCITCQLKRLMSELKLCELEEERETVVAQELLKFYAEAEEKRSAWLGFKARAFMQELTDVADPYMELKTQLNEFAAGELPPFRAYLADITNREKKFQRVCLGSVLGNLLEFFLSEHEFAVKFPQPLVEMLETERFAMDATSEIFQMLEAGAKKILILPDNAGEIFFDRVLIETLKELFPNIHITVAVKSAPIINDATLDDAREADLESIADRVMSSGINSIGLFLEETSEEFRQVWQNSDLIIEKGMGHFETSDISSEPLPCPVFHLFRVKCTTVADIIGAKLNDNIALIKR